jgi:hypothetical protein
MAGGCVRYKGGGWVSSGAIAAVRPRESRGDLVRWLVKWLGGLESSIHSHEASPTLIEREPRCDCYARDSYNWTRCGVVGVLFAAMALLFCCSAVLLANNVTTDRGQQ